MSPSDPVRVPDDAVDAILDQIEAMPEERRDTLVLVDGTGRMMTLGALVTALRSAPSAAGGRVLDMSGVETFDIRIGRFDIEKMIAGLPSSSPVEALDQSPPVPPLLEPLRACWGQARPEQEGGRRWGSKHRHPDPNRKAKRKQARAARRKNRGR